MSLKWTQTHSKKKTPIIALPHHHWATIIRWQECRSKSCTTVCKHLNNINLENHTRITCSEDQSSTGHSTLTAIEDSIQGHSHRTIISHPWPLMDGNMRSISCPETEIDENDGYNGQRLSSHPTLASDIGKYIIRYNNDPGNGAYNFQWAYQNDEHPAQH